MVSLNQCTPSSTREPATMNAIAAAADANTTCWRDERPRPRHSAHAAKHAAAEAECPLGNEKPDAPVRGANDGRSRPTNSLTRFVARTCPPITTIRNRMTPRVERRRSSRAATVAASRITNGVAPASVMIRNTSVLVLVPSAAAHWATSRSRWTTALSVRISNASKPTTTSATSESVSARPVISAGLVRRRTNAANRSWNRICRSTARAVPCTNPWVAVVAPATTAHTAAAATPASAITAASTTSSIIEPPATGNDCRCSLSAARGTNATTPSPSRTRPR